MPDGCCAAANGHDGALGLRKLCRKKFSDLSLACHVFSLSI
jgi:hypothetical protein